MFTENVACVIQFPFSVDCSKPPNVTNAKVIYNKTLIHSRAVYACLPGYEHIAGSDETTCLRTGDWEHPNMTCTRECYQAGREHVLVL